MKTKKTISTEMIAKRNEYLVLVAKMTGLAADDIMSRCRKHELVQARFLLIWALCELCGYTRTDVAILMRMSHMNVVYAVKVMNGLQWRLKESEEQCKQMLTDYWEKGVQP